MFSGLNNPQFRRVGSIFIFGALTLSLVHQASTGEAAAHWKSSMDDERYYFSIFKTKK
jgi:hypothetical protein